MREHAHRAAAGVLLAVVAAGVAGCAAAPMSAADGTRHYEAVMAELTDELVAEYPAVLWETESESTHAAADAGECRLYLPTRSTTSDEIVEGTPEELWEAVNRVLGQHEFDDIVGLDEDTPGGWEVASTRDARGAELRISAKPGFPVSLDLTAPVEADACR